MGRSQVGKANEQTAGNVKITDNILNRDDDTVLSNSGIGKLLDTVVLKESEVFDPNVKFAIWMEDGKLCKYQRDKTKQLIEVNGKENVSGNTIDSSEPYGFRAHIMSESNDVYIGAPTITDSKLIQLNTSNFEFKRVDAHKYTVTVISLVGVVGETDVLGINADLVKYRRTINTKDGLDKGFRSIHAKVDNFQSNNGLEGETGLFKIKVDNSNNIFQLYKEHDVFENTNSDSIHLYKSISIDNDIVVTQYHEHIDVNLCDNVLSVDISKLVVGDTFDIEYFGIPGITSTDIESIPRNFTGGRLVINENIDEVDMCIIGGSFGKSTAHLSTNQDLLLPYGLTLYSDNIVEKTMTDTHLIDICRNVRCFDDTDINGMKTFVSGNERHSFISKVDGGNVNTNYSNYSHFINEGTHSDNMSIKNRYSKKIHFTDTDYFKLNLPTPNIHVDPTVLTNVKHVDVATRLQSFKAIIGFDVGTDESYIKEVHNQYVSNGSFTLIKDTGFNAYYPTVTTTPDHMGNIIGNKVKPHPKHRYSVWADNDRMNDWSRQGVGGVVKTPILNRGTTPVSGNRIYSNNAFKYGVYNRYSISNSWLDNAVIERNTYTTKVTGTATNGTSLIDLLSTITYDSAFIMKAITNNQVGLGSANQNGFDVILCTRIQNNSDTDSLYMHSDLNLSISTVVPPQTIGTLYIKAHLASGLEASLNTKIRTCANGDVANMNSTSIDYDILESVVLPIDFNNHHHLTFKNNFNDTEPYNYNITTFIDDPVDVHCIDKNYVSTGIRLCPHNSSNIIQLFNSVDLDALTEASVIPSNSTILETDDRSIVIVGSTRLDLQVDDRDFVNENLFNKELDYIIKNESMLCYDKGVKMYNSDDDSRIYFDPKYNSQLSKFTGLGYPRNYSHGGYKTFSCFDSGLSIEELEYQKWLIDIGMIDFGNNTDTEIRLTQNGGNTKQFNFYKYTSENGGWMLDGLHSGIIFENAGIITVRIGPDPSVNIVDNLYPTTTPKITFPDCFKPISKSEIMCGDSGGYLCVAYLADNTKSGERPTLGFSRSYNAIDDNISKTPRGILSIPRKPKQ